MLVTLCHYHPIFSSTKKESKTSEKYKTSNFLLLFFSSASSMKTHVLLSPSAAVITATAATNRTAIIGHGSRQAVGLFCNPKCCFLSVRSHQPQKSPYPTLTSQKRHRNVFIPQAAESTQPAAAAASSASAKSAVVTDEEFSLAKVSFGVIGLGLGVSLLSYGFGAYFNLLPGSEWSAIMLTYGFPLAIIGMALKYAELKPVPCLTYSDAQKLRETCATPILKQVRNDVIRYRYGDEQHLDEALKRIFQYGLGSGIARRNAPILQMIREEVTEDGRYCLVLVFKATGLELSEFEKRQGKFTSFFGPDITAEVGKGENDLYEVRLISNIKASASSS